jgi:hypothetical protein
MKKIRITENELISLIEKMVKENMGAIPSLSAHGGGFANLGMGKPTDKYKDLYEDGDLENVDEDDATTGSDELQLSVTSEPDVEDDWTGGSGRNPSTNMESIVNRLKKKLNEDEGRAMQDMTKEIEKRGTEGSFRKWCESKNKSWDGCSPECWDAAMATNDKSLHLKVSGAKFYCG